MFAQEGDTVKFESIPTSYAPEGGYVFPTGSNRELFPTERMSAADAIGRSI